MAPKEEASARPGREELRPPVQVCFGLSVECDVVVKAADSGAEVDEPAEGNSPGWNHLPGESELTDERARNALCMCENLPGSSGSREAHSFRSMVMEAVMAVEFSCMPSKVRLVDDPQSSHV